MPLLPLEPFVYPEDLLEQPVAAAGTPPHTGGCCTPGRVPKNRWHADCCCAIRRLFSFPLRKRQWRHRGRLLCSYVPLFPGYVFLHSDSQSVFQHVRNQYGSPSLAGT